MSFKAILVGALCSVSLMSATSSVSLAAGCADGWLDMASESFMASHNNGDNCRDYSYGVQAMCLAERCGGGVSFFEGMYCSAKAYTAQIGCAL